MVNPVVKHCVLMLSMSGMGMTMVVKMVMVIMVGLELIWDLAKVAVLGEMVVVVIWTRLVIIVMGLRFMILIIIMGIKHRIKLVLGMVVGMVLHIVSIIPAGMVIHLMMMDNMESIIIDMAAVGIVDGGGISIMGIVVRGMGDRYIILTTRATPTIPITQRYPNTIIPKTLANAILILEIIHLFKIVHVYNK